MTQVVTFQELNCKDGNKIGVATLNSPKSLNALSGDMIDLLFPKLKVWQAQNDIAAVLLQGEGEKSFCAGGDIVHMYKAMKHCQSTKDSDGYSPEIEEYFIKEYQLDYLIHTYKKPFIVWGNGIVMGGGLGLMVGASHRVVTESSRLAMPEISIGLYPDVGGSYFLNRMPENCGLFLGITGASINAADAKYCHLADHFMVNDDKNKFIEQLRQVNWVKSYSKSHDEISTLLTKFEQNTIDLIPESKLIEHQETINQVTAQNSLNEIVKSILTVNIEDKWFIRAQNSLNSGSPLSACIAYKQIQLGKTLSLAQCFQMELNLSVKSGQFGEFVEGVRALLIDKDNQPKWHYDSIDSVDKKVVDWFFESKWSKEQHPLQHLND